MRCGSVVGLVLVLAILPRPAGACREYISIASRVEQAPVIVVGRVAFIEENKHVVRTYETGGNTKDAGGRAYRQRWLHEATLLVTRVLKGDARLLKTELGDGPVAVGRLRLLSDGVIEESDNPGMFSMISTDDRIRPEEEGVWFLRPGEVGRAYRGDDQNVPMEQLGEVERCLEALKTGYAGRASGFAPDDESWVVALGSTEDVWASASFNSEGSAFLVGATSGTLTLGSATIKGESAHDTFIAQIDRDGRLAWYKTLTPTPFLGSQVTAGADGSWLVSGDIGLMFPRIGRELRADEQGKWLVACIGADGALRWVHAIDGRVAELKVLATANGGSDVWSSVIKEEPVREARCRQTYPTTWSVRSLDRKGKAGEVRAVELGTTEGTLYPVSGSSIGAVVVTPFWNADQSQRRLCVTALTRAAQVAWVDTVGGRWDNDIHAVASNGSILVAASTITHDAITPFAAGAMMGEMGLRPGERHRHLSAWSIKGERLWDVTGGASQLAFGPDGNIYCYGSYANTPWSTDKTRPDTMGDEDIFLECFTPEGERLWVVRDGGVNTESASRMGLLPNGRAVLAGSFAGTTFLGGSVRGNNGHRSSFVMNVALPRPTGIR